MPNGRQMEGGDRTPVPDPTLLTTEALQREVLGLRELIEQRIDGLKELLVEKDKRIAQQFALVERQRVEQKKDTKDAVDAALTAQKEAVKEQTTASDRAIAKSEGSMTKQLEEIKASFSTEFSSFRRELNEVKEMVSGVVQQKVGAAENRTGLYAAIGVIGTILLVGIAVVGFLAARGGP